MTTIVSTQPYLVRAIHEWCVDQGLTPYVVVHVDENVVVPAGYARDGQIVLNLHPDATNRLAIDNEAIHFQARFGGVPQDLWLPYPSVLAIYARENGRGLAFSQGVAFELNPLAEEGEEGEEGAEETVGFESIPGDGPSDPDDSPLPSRSRGNHLKVVK